MDGIRDNLIYVDFGKACVNGDIKGMKIKFPKDNSEYILDEEHMIKTIKGGTQNHKKIIEYLIDMKANLFINENIILQCLNNNWNSIARKLAMKYDNIGSLTDNSCIIKLISMDNNALSQKILTRNLDYMGKNDKVMIHLCEQGKADLIKKLMSITFIDPNYNDDIFIKSGARHKDVIRILTRNNTSSSNEKLRTHIAISQYGGI